MMRIQPRKRGLATWFLALWTLLVGALASPACSAPKADARAFAALDQLPESRVQRVSALSRRDVSDVVELVTSGGAVTATPEHPFAVAGRGWIPAGSLVAGDRLLSLRGEPAVLLQTSRVARAVAVYNLTVERGHAYFVGDDALLVHNACLFPSGSGRITDAETAAAEAKFDQQKDGAADFLQRDRAGARAVRQYTGPDYGVMNRVLRGQATPDEVAAYTPIIDKAAQALKDAARAGHGFKGVVTRAERRSQLPQHVLDFYLDLEPGASFTSSMFSCGAWCGRTPNDNFTPPAFLSTSVKPISQSTFLGPPGDNIVMRIRSKTGVPVEGLSHYPGEKEVLFPPSTKFRFLGRRTLPDGTLVMDFEEATP